MAGLEERLLSLIKELEEEKRLADKRAKQIYNKETFLLLFITNIKSGATQGAAGAAANELWKTSGHATLPDNVIMIGV